MKAKATQKNIFLLALPTLAVLTIAATLFWFFDRMKAANTMRDQTLQTLITAQTLLTSVVDSETGVRGYLLTGDEAMLKPYTSVQGDVSETLKKLRDISFTPAAINKVDTIAPLIEQKMARLAAALLLQQSGDTAAIANRLRSGEGMRLMESIRLELERYHQLQQVQLSHYNRAYEANINYLFVFIICASVFMLLFAQVFAYGIYRNIHQRLMNLMHQETKRSLDTQEAMNHQLNLAYVTVQDSEKKLDVTLNSIADAVIATDKEARITLMNHVAEQLTGYSQEMAMGCPISDIFHIVNKENREPMTSPVMETLVKGAAIGSNDSILILKSGKERNIATSCAPIRDHDGQAIGAVLVFRDITAENAAQQALLDSTELVQAIFGTVADGIVTINPRTKLIETANAAAEKMFGYSADELVGKQISSIVPELSQDADTFSYYNISPSERAYGIAREATGQQKEGLQFPIEIAISEMRLGGQRYFTGVLRNITARKHAEAVMRESEDRYRNLFDTIDEGFCVAELIYEGTKPVDHRFLEVNPSFTKQSGLDAVAGKTLLEIVPNMEQEWFDIYHQVVTTGEPVRFIKEAAALNRWFDVYTCRLGGPGSRKTAILFTDITERKRSEQALLESDERVRLATEATGVGIWEWNLSKNIMRWDAQMFRIYGLTPTPDGIVRGEDWNEHLLPEDRRSQEAITNITDKGEGGSTREFRIRRSGEKDIRYIRSVETMRTNSKGQVESIVGTNLDITELKRTEDTLRESERHLRAVIDALPVAIYTTDANGSLTQFNQAAVEFSGRTPQLGSDHWCISMNLFRPDGSHLPHHECPMATALKEGRQILGAEAIAERPDGSRVWFNAYPTPLHDTQGKLIGGINMLIDITERKRLDQVILENNIELKKAKNLAERANLAKSDFLSNMSHELRTPLSAILGFAQLLEASNPPPSANQQRSLDQILQAGWYLLDLINEILDLTLIESGKLSLSIEPVSLLDLMSECKAMMVPQALKRKISLDFPQFDTQLMVKADHTRLKQVFINLLSNAVKYNRDGGKVIVSYLTSAPGKVRVSVRDTGEGLEPEKLAQLFQPFNRLGKENSSEEGTGIGLVMTKRLIELMGGKINVESTPGEGTVFWLDLYISSQTQIVNDNKEPADIRLTPSTQGAPKRSLLYVEDNPANLMLIEDVLAPRSDITLITAQDGYSGLELARIAQPDLILMDINLPGINGTEVLKMLAKDALTTHIPVIALSANAIPRDIEKGLEAGFFRYLTKPIKINEFMNTLDAALEFAARRSIRVNEERAR